MKIISFYQICIKDIMSYRLLCILGELSLFSDVRIKLKKKNKILFSHDSKCLQKLIVLMESQNHRTLAMWALDCAKLPLQQFELKYPHEHRPRICLKACESWARGKIKMPEAKRTILDSHAVAKEIDDAVYGALCHAIGHAGATVHVKTHALGLPIYELTALVLKYGQDDFPIPISEKINYYHSRLQNWQDNIDKYKFKWADFLLKNNSSNKRIIK